MNDIDQNDEAALQQRLYDAKCENVLKTVSEIRTTVSKEVESRKDAFDDAKGNVRDAMDWKVQFRKRPVTFTAGAVFVGALIGRRLFARNISTMEYAYYRAMLREEERDRQRAKYEPMGYYQPRPEDHEEAQQRRQRSAMARKSPWAALLALAVTQTAKVAGRSLVPMVMAAVTGKVAADAATDDNEEKKKQKIVVVPQGASVNEVRAAGQVDR